MFRLGHVSDIHISARIKATPKRFLNKRILGGTNLLLKRKKSHSNGAVIQAFSQLVDHGVDHIAVSGDLTNLALAEEFAAAKLIIEAVPDSANMVSVVPGNHDYYTKHTQSARTFERTFEAYIQSDLPTYQLDGAYPYCKLLGDDVALIGINTGIATPWFIAAGQVDERELRALGELLKDPRLEGRAVVVMLHHPLLPYEHTRVQRSRRLRNEAEVLRMLRMHDVTLAIHGHNHHYGIHHLPHLRGHGVLHICEAGSAGVTKAKSPDFAGKYNIYHFDGPKLHHVETFAWDSEKHDFFPWKKTFFHDPS